MGNSLLVWHRPMQISPWVEDAIVGRATGQFFECIPRGCEQQTKTSKYIALTKDSRVPGEENVNTQLDGSPHQPPIITCGDTFGRFIDDRIRKD